MLSRIHVVTRVDHGLTHTQTATAPTRFEIIFADDTKVFSETLPDITVFKMKDPDLNGSD